MKTGVFGGDGEREKNGASSENFRATITAVQISGVNYLEI